MTAATSRTDSSVVRAHRHLAILALALAALCIPASGASAASSYDSCVGFIDVVPIVISTPGRWCLRQNITTSDSAVYAINIATNNVTIDCNGFRLSNLPAGIGTRSSGIVAFQANAQVTVRNCMIEGFAYGTYIATNPPGTGYVIENNRFSQNRWYGVRLAGVGSVVRGNIVTNTGRLPNADSGTGIHAAGNVEVIDNVVDGVSGDGSVSNFTPIGIYAGNDAFIPVLATGVQVRGNRVRNLIQIGRGQAEGISVDGPAMSVRDNLIVQRDQTPGWGVVCADGDGRVRDNVIQNYTSAIAIGICIDDGGNAAY